MKKNYSSISLITICATFENNHKSKNIAIKYNSTSETDCLDGLMISKIIQEITFTASKNLTIISDIANIVFKNIL